MPGMTGQADTCVALEGKIVQADTFVALEGKMYMWTRLSH